jgi:hypothetical protein
VKRRLAVAAAVLLLAGWGGWGLRVVQRRAERPEPPAGELRGAYHVHTTRSDGLGTLDEVLRAARAARLQFVVVTDHNVITPGEAGWHDGVLVVEAHEASTRWGHVVALGAPRALSLEERNGQPLQVMRALGADAVLAHPFHARRPFSGWGQEPWRGLEVVSNDTAWGEVVAGRAFGRALATLVTLPFDGGQAVAGLVPSPAREFEALDRALRTTPDGPRRPDGQLAPGRVALCSADAHGYPSYRAAFEAFSMHLPLAPTGDGVADGAAVLRALADGRGSCVFDAVAPAARIELGPGPGGALRLQLETGPGLLDRASARFFHDGAPAGLPQRTQGGWRVTCPGGCGAGHWRAEVTLDGRPWIFTNPVVIE